MSECLRCGSPIEEGAQECGACGMSQSEAAELGQGAPEQEPAMEEQQQPAADPALPGDSAYGAAAEAETGSVAVMEAAQEAPPATDAPAQPEAAEQPQPEAAPYFPPAAQQAQVQPPYPQPASEAAAYYPQAAPPAGPGVYPPPAQPYEPYAQPDPGYAPPAQDGWGQQQAGWGDNYQAPQHQQQPYPPQGAQPYPAVQQPLYGAPAGAAYPQPKKNRKNMIIILVAAVISVILIGVCIYALVRPSTNATGLDGATQALVAELEPDEQRIAMRALSFLNAAKSGRRDMVADYVHPDEVEELVARLGTEEAAMAYLADQLTDRVLDMYEDGFPGYVGLEVRDSGEWRASCRITLDNEATVSVALEMVYGEYYVVGVSGGSGKLSPEAQALIDTVSENAQPAATRAMEFLEAVLDDNPSLVEEYLHPELMSDINSGGYSYYGYSGSGSPGEQIIQRIHSICGPNPTGYQRMNASVEQYGTYASASVSVYFDQAYDFLIINMELVDGEYYVTYMY